MVRRFRVKELLNLLGLTGHKRVVKKNYRTNLKLVELDPAIIINEITSTSDRRHAAISCIIIQFGHPCVL